MCIPLVGQVLWDDDAVWYDATVLEYRDGLHKVKYHDDGLEEWINFDGEQIAVVTRVVWAKVKGHPWWPAKVRATLAWAAAARSAHNWLAGPFFLLPFLFFSRGWC